MDDTALLNEVRGLRREMPRVGVRKLKVLLYQRGHDVGRDRLFSLLKEAGMLTESPQARCSVSMAASMA